MAVLDDGEASQPAEKIDALEKIFEEYPGEAEALAGLAFYHALQGNWEQSLAPLSAPFSTGPAGKATAG